MKSQQDINTSSYQARKKSFHKDIKQNSQQDAMQSRLLVNKIAKFLLSAMNLANRGGDHTHNRAYQPKRWRRKTTLAIHLATAFSAGGYKTLVLELDPQPSAAEWKDSRTYDTPNVMAVPAARLWINIRIISM